MQSAKSKLQSEEGVVESTLVMIPLLVLFLLTLEIIIAINLRNVDLTLTQSEASTRAISSVLADHDEIIDSDSSLSFDSMRVLIAQRERTLPRLVPQYLLRGAEGDHNLKVRGLAVMEMNR